jgi:gliding motility-associated-like protein
MKIEVQQPPELGQLQDTSLIIGEEISYTVDAGKGFQYLWSPSEGVDCATCPNPTFSPLITTPYTLQVFDPSGCFNISRKVLIEIIEKYSLDVPSAFSPNGDGVNDIIYARGWGLKELKSFKIYNRFGELVFESQDFENGWDGTYRGKDQNIETYVYTVEVLTFGGEILTKKGNISLIR